MLAGKKMSTVVMLDVGEPVREVREIIRGPRISEIQKRFIGGLVIREPRAEPQLHRDSKMCISKVRTNLTSPPVAAAIRQSASPDYVPHPIQAMSCPERTLSKAQTERM